MKTFRSTDIHIIRFEAAFVPVIVKSVAGAFFENKHRDTGHYYFYQFI